MENLEIQVNENNNRNNNNRNNNNRNNNIYNILNNNIQNNNNIIRDNNLYIDDVLVVTVLPEPQVEINNDVLVLPEPEVEINDDVLVVTVLTEPQVEIVVNAEHESNSSDGEILSDATTELVTPQRGTSKRGYSEMVKSQRVPSEMVKPQRGYSEMVKPQRVPSEMVKPTTQYEKVDDDDTLEHLVLTTQETERILSVSTPHEKYIILLNDILQAKNRNYIQIIKDLEISVSELKIESNYAHNLLNNYMKIKKLYGELSDNQNYIIQNTRYTHNIFKQKAIRHLRIFQSLLLIFLAIWYEYHIAWVDFLPILGIFAVFVAFQESTLYNLRFSDCKENFDRIYFLQTEITDSVEDYDL